MIETTKRWISQHLCVDGEAVDWVLEPKGSIKKDNLSFTYNFLLLLVQQFLSPTATDNIVTWDHEVLMVAMVVGFEVDFTWLLQLMMHERDFTSTTTYLVPCIVFEFGRSSGVPVWHIDVMKTPPGIVDINLIWEEANELAPNRGHRP